MAGPAAGVPAVPVPAMTESVPFGLSCLTSWLPVSAMSTLPVVGSTATPLGALRPEATTEATPAGVTLNTSLSAESAM